MASSADQTGTTADCELNLLKQFLLVALTVELDYALPKDIGEEVGMELYALATEAIERQFDACASNNRVRGTAKLATASEFNEAGEREGFDELADLEVDSPAAEPMTRVAKSVRCKRCKSSWATCIASYYWRVADPAPRS